MAFIVCECVMRTIEPRMVHDPLEYFCSIVVCIS